MRSHSFRHNGNGRSYLSFTLCVCALNEPELKHSPARPSHFMFFFISNVSFYSQTHGFSQFSIFFYVSVHLWLFFFFLIFCCLSFGFKLTLLCFIIAIYFVNMYICMHSFIFGRRSFTFDYFLLEFSFRILF